jgi:hypothetical protein
MQALANAALVCRKQRIVASYLEIRSCVDCGESDPVVLEFDHVRGVKDRSISDAVRKLGVRRLLEEIAKCEIRCVNCHKRATVQRGRHWRLDLSHPNSRPERRLSRPDRERGQRMLATFLRIHGCVDCGESDPVVLEFDHVRGTKLAAVTSMVSRTTRALGVIRDEIAKCDVRCGNCHRRKTAVTQGSSRVA